MNKIDLFILIIFLGASCCNTYIKKDTFNSNFTDCVAFSPLNEFHVREISGLFAREKCPEGHISFCYYGTDIYHRYPPALLFHFNVNLKLENIYEKGVFLMPPPSFVVDSLRIVNYNFNIDNYYDLYIFFDNKNPVNSIVLDTKKKWGKKRAIFGYDFFYLSIRYVGPFIKDIWIPDFSSRKPTVKKMSVPVYYIVEIE
jgi:hypothetical protein